VGFAAISGRSWRKNNASLSFPAALFRSSTELARSFFAYPFSPTKEPNAGRP
jgi:hypothetical protein